MYRALRVASPFVVFLAGCLPPAQPQQTRLAADAAAQAAGDADAHGRKVMALFGELTKIFRPSGKEDGVRAWLVKLVDDTNKRVGREVAKQEQDEVGNLIIRLEGSGRYAPSKTPIALQAHMDMIHAVKGAAPGDDLTPYFQNGVQLEESNGFVHTKDFKTTLGADDGIGVATAVRYLADFEQDHPPLELLFTMSEEQGLVGSKKLGLSLSAPVLLNLDTSLGATFIYGCLGSQRVFAKASLPGTPLPGDWRVVKLVLSGLKGGHSGKVINEKRLNAVVGIATAVKKVKDELGEASLLELRAGAEAAINAIPGDAAAWVAVPGAKIDQARDVGLAALQAALAAATDEDASAARAEATVLESNDGVAQAGLDGDKLDKLVGTVLEVRNGVITQKPDSPNGVNTSSNLGWLSVAAEGGAIGLHVGLMLRSYVFDEIVRYGGEAADTLKRVADGATVDAVPPSPPWLADTNGWLFKLAQQTAPDYKTSLTAGGIEPAAFAEKFPGLAMLSLGAATHDIHAPEESLEVASVSATAATLDRLLAAIAASEPVTTTRAALRAPRESILLRALDERETHPQVPDACH